MMHSLSAPGQTSSEDTPYHKLRRASNIIISGHVSNNLNFMLNTDIKIGADIQTG